MKLKKGSESIRGAKASKSNQSVYDDKETVHSQRVTILKRSGPDQQAARDGQIRLRRDG